MRGKKGDRAGSRYGAAFGTAGKCERHGTCNR